MKIWRITFAMLAIVLFNACRPSTPKDAHGMNQPTDSVTTDSIHQEKLTEGVHLLLKGGSLSLPLDSLVVEMINNTEDNCVTGESYVIECRVDGQWTSMPIKPRKDGAVFAFNDIGYELVPQSSRLFTIHVEPDKYDFERGQEYRIAKEFFKKGKKELQSVYCYFKTE